MKSAWAARAACALALIAIAGTRPAAAVDALTPQQKSAVDQAIHDYIESHPEVVLDALRAAQKKLDAEALEEARRVIIEKHDELFADPDDLVQGDPKGDATIVEFFDYRCPYCKEVEPSLEALVKQDPKLRIVYKEFPILGEPSVFATHVALASRRHGKYPEFHRAMMAAKGEIDDDKVMKIAASVGLDPAVIKAELASPEIERIIRANYALGDLLGLQGTPGIVIGDALIPGAVDIDTLRESVAAARKGE